MHARFTPKEIAAIARACFMGYGEMCSVARKYSIPPHILYNRADAIVLTERLRLAALPNAAMLGDPSVSYAQRCELMWAEANAAARQS